MYRPDGLKVPEEYKPTLALSPDKQTQYLLDNIWLAGADAMLEGLKKGGGFRCSIIGVQSIQATSIVGPLRFAIQTQSISEDCKGYTEISLPHFNPIEYPYRKGYLVFIPGEIEDAIIKS